MDSKQGVITTSVLPGALRAGLTWAHGLSRLNGPKEMTHHQEPQSTGKFQLLQTEYWGDEELKYSSQLQPKKSHR